MGTLPPPHDFFLKAPPIKTDSTIQIKNKPPTSPPPPFSGDAARRDQDGHYYITGHVDDAINVKGVSIGPNEIEDDIVRVKGIPSFVDCLSQIETSVILE